MNRRSDSQTDDWEADWEGAWRVHMRRFRAMSLSEKLEALEDMVALAEVLNPEAVREARERQLYDGRHGDPEREGPKSR